MLHTCVQTFNVMEFLEVRRELNSATCILVVLVAFFCVCVLILGWIEREIGTM